MFRTITTLIVGVLISVVQAEICGRPEVENRNVFIYAISDIRNITIHHCFHTKSSRITYSDITENCLNAMELGVFVDKFNNVNNFARQNKTKGYLMNYITKADLLENKVFLKSGTVCRYDRGFCYDPKENLNYAVVWNTDLTPGVFTGDLVFQGITDIWSFKNDSLKYLFHDNYKDEAFSLQLLKMDRIRNITFWYTDKKFIVADGPLFGHLLFSVNPNELSVRSKVKVSEDILKNCDIQSLEFTKSILPSVGEYFTDSHDMVTLLRTYGHIIGDVNEIRKDVHNKIDKYITSLEITLKQKDNDIEYLRSNLLKINETLANYVLKLENVQKKLIECDQKSLENEMKNTMSSNYEHIDNKLNNLERDLKDQENTNINVTEKLNQLNKLFLDLESKNIKILSEVQFAKKDAHDFTSNSLKDLQVIMEYDLHKLSEKQDTMLKIINKVNNTNHILNHKLIILNESIVNINNNASIWKSFSGPQNQLENQITALRLLMMNLKTKYFMDLQKQFKDESENLAQQYNLLNKRLLENGNLTSSLKEQIIEIDKTVTNLNQQNKNHNDYVVHLESNLLEKFNNYEINFKNSVKDLAKVKEQILTELMDIREKYQNLIQNIKLKGNTNPNSQTLFSTEEDNEKPNVISSNSKDLESLNKLIIRNTKNIALILSRIENEKENVELLQNSVNKNTDEIKALSGKINKIERRQSSTELTLNYQINQITGIKNNLNNVMIKVNANKCTTVNCETKINTNLECGECNDRFKSLDQRLSKLEESLTRKDEEIDTCHAELQTLWKQKDEEIAKINDEMKNLKELLLYNV